MIFTLAIIPTALMICGAPVFLVLLTASAATVLFVMDVPVEALHQTLFGAIDSFALLAVPFFLYAGELMGRGSVARRIVDIMQAATGSMRGSLPLATVGTSAVFGAMSGASAATVATIGSLMLKPLAQRGYPEQFRAGLITAVGAIDVIIPPSIPLIIYAAAASESVPKLYAAGVVPGLLIAAILAVYVVWYARRLGISDGLPFSARQLFVALRRGSWALGAPVIILGGIYGGLFSPTESAAVACVYAALVTRFVYRELSWDQIIECAARTVMLSAQILIIVACANVFGWLLTVNQIPMALVDLVQGWQLSPWMILLALNIVFLVVGCFVDPLSAILVLTPLLMPLVKAAGIDPVHFGIVITTNLAIGMFHPPFGLNIFVAQSLFKFPLEVIYRGIVPFLFLYLAALVLITYIPWLSLAAVRLIY
ncbi:TRAP transporter large permease [Aquabacterium sp.]|uniref:TRAP transporter large permease n=1 Tax=Aquabacterium sp. TaxID=1872578 RepID=UPI002BCCA0BE|nr:TRAP transporter large permease [Aquabacterium sp.]HSW05901.1 TRAP transporter large permease [Aquabacterium sp.]